MLGQHIPMAYLGNMSFLAPEADGMGAPRRGQPRDGGRAHVPHGHDGLPVQGQGRPYREVSVPRMDSVPTSLC